MNSTPDLISSPPAPLRLQEKGTGVEVPGLIPRSLRRLKNNYNRYPPLAAGRFI